MLIFAFVLASLAMFLQAVIFPSISFLVFAPWIALVILKSERSNNLSKVLWLASLAGAFNDLFSDHPIGLHAITYCLSALFLFRSRHYFLYDKPLHLSLLTTLVSLVSTQLQLFFLFLFDRRAPFTGKWAFIDSIGMPIADGLFSLIWFAGPLFLFYKATRSWTLFWKKKNLSPTSH